MLMLEKGPIKQQHDQSLGLNKLIQHPFNSQYEAWAVSIPNQRPPVEQDFTAVSLGVSL